MKYLIIILMLVTGNAYAKDSKDVYEICTPRTKATPAYCFESTLNKPTTHNIAKAGAYVAGVATAIVGVVAGSTTIIVTVVGVFTCSLVYYYFDSFVGPVYEENERSFTKAVRNNKYLHYLF